VAASQALDPRRDHGAFHVGPAGAQHRAAAESGDTEDEFYDPDDEATVATIKELLDTRIRPAVAGDGGDITFRGFKDGTVYLAMKGACSGCPSSTATLKHGIQNLLKHFLPDVREVEAI
jgi:Fe-S cluster biogenesis protein NfuA